MKSLIFASLSVFVIASLQSARCKEDTVKFTVECKLPKNATDKSRLIDVRVLDDELEADGSDIREIAVKPPSTSSDNPADLQAEESGDAFQLASPEGPPTEDKVAFSSPDTIEDDEKVESPTPIRDAQTDKLKLPKLKKSETDLSSDPSSVKDDSVKTHLQKLADKLKLPKLKNTGSTSSSNTDEVKEDAIKTPLQKLTDRLKLPTLKNPVESPSNINEAKEITPLQKLSEKLKSIGSLTSPSEKVESQLLEDSEGSPSNINEMKVDKLQTPLQKLTDKLKLPKLKSKGSSLLGESAPLVEDSEASPSNMNEVKEGKKLSDKLKNIGSEKVESPLLIEDSEGSPSKIDEVKVDKIQTPLQKFTDRLKLPKLKSILSNSPNEKVESQPLVEDPETSSSNMNEVKDSAKTPLQKLSDKLKLPKLKNIGSSLSTPQSEKVESQPPIEDSEVSPSNTDEVKEDNTKTSLKKLSDKLKLPKLKNIESLLTPPSEKVEFPQLVKDSEASPSNIDEVKGDKIKMSMQKLSDKLKLPKLKNIGSSLSTPPGEKVESPPLVKDSEVSPSNEYNTKTSLQKLTDKLKLPKLKNIGGLSTSPSEKVESPQLVEDSEVSPSNVDEVKEDNAKTSLQKLSDKLKLPKLKGIGSLSTAQSEKVKSQPLIEDSQVSSSNMNEVKEDNTKTPLQKLTDKLKLPKLKNIGRLTTSPSEKVEFPQLVEDSEVSPSNVDEVKEDNAKTSLQKLSDKLKLPKLKGIGSLLTPPGEKVESPPLIENSKGSPINIDEVKEDNAKTPLKKLSDKLKLPKLKNIEGLSTSPSERVKSPQLVEDSEVSPSNLDEVKEDNAKTPLQKLSDKLKLPKLKNIEGLSTSPSERVKSPQLVEDSEVSPSNLDEVKEDNAKTPLQTLTDKLKLPKLKNIGILSTPTEKVKSPSLIKDYIVSSSNTDEVKDDNTKTPLQKLTDRLKTPKLKNIGSLSNPSSEKVESEASSSNINEMKEDRVKASVQKLTDKLKLPKLKNIGSSLSTLPSERVESSLIKDSVASPSNIDEVKEDKVKASLQKLTDKLKVPKLKNTSSSSSNTDEVKQDNVKASLQNLTDKLKLPKLKNIGSTSTAPLVEDSVASSSNTDEVKEDKVKAFLQKLPKLKSISNPSENVENSSVKEDKIKASLQKLKSSPFQSGKVELFPLVRDSEAASSNIDRVKIDAPMTADKFLTSKSLLLGKGADEPSLKRSESGLRAAGSEISPVRYPNARTEKELVESALALKPWQIKKYLKTKKMEALKDVERLKARKALRHLRNKARDAKEDAEDALKYASQKKSGEAFQRPSSLRLPEKSETAAPKSPFKLKVPDEPIAAASNSRASILPFKLRSPDSAAVASNFGDSKSPIMLRLRKADEPATSATKLETLKSPFKLKVPERSAASNSRASIAPFKLREPESSSNFGDSKSPIMLRLRKADEPATSATKLEALKSPFKLKVPERSAASNSRTSIDPFKLRSPERGVSDSKNPVISRLRKVDEPINLEALRSPFKLRSNSNAEEPKVAPTDILSTLKRPLKMNSLEPVNAASNAEPTKVPFGLKSPKNIFNLKSPSENERAAVVKRPFGLSAVGPKTTGYSKEALRSKEPEKLSLKERLDTLKAKLPSDSASAQSVQRPLLAKPRSKAGEPLVVDPSYLSESTKKQAPIAKNSLGVGGPQLEKAASEVTKGLGFADKVATFNKNGLVDKALTVITHGTNILRNNLSSALRDALAGGGNVTTAPQESSDLEVQASNDAETCDVCDCLMKYKFGSNRAAAEDMTVEQSGPSPVSEPPSPDSAPPPPDQQLRDEARLVQLIEFANIMDQLSFYISDKTKMLIRKMRLLLDEDVARVLL